jgi:hypothetical protein
LGAAAVALSTFTLVHHLPWDGASSSGGSQGDSGGFTGRIIGDAANFRSAEGSGPKLAAPAALPRREVPAARAVTPQQVAAAGPAPGRQAVNSPGADGAVVVASLPLTPLEAGSCVAVKASGASDAAAAGGQQAWLPDTDLKVRRVVQEGRALRAMVLSCRDLCCRRTDPKHHSVMG